MTNDNERPTRLAEDAYVLHAQSFVGGGQYWGFGISIPALIEARWRCEGLRPDQAMEVRPEGRWRYA